jgi:hypothetical protein
MSEEILSNHVPNSEIEYRAGSCNIGRGEIRRRQFVAIVGTALTVFITFELLRRGTPRTKRLGIFFPAMIAAIGFLQARKRFCLAFGLSGIFNFGTLGNVQKVISPQDRALDRKTALTLLLQSAALALAVTLVVYLLPGFHSSIA